MAIITPAGVLEEESLSEYWKPFRTIIEDATQGRGLLGRVMASFGLDILFSVYRGGQSKGSNRDLLASLLVVLVSVWGGRSVKQSNRGLLAYLRVALVLAS